MAGEMARLVADEAAGKAADEMARLVVNMGVGRAACDLLLRLPPA